MLRRLGSEDLADQAWRLAPFLRAGREVHGFRHLGQGCFRIALLGPDGVVYKVSHRDTVDDQFSEELSFFRLLEGHGFTWCPDYYPYPDRSVMAMPQYGELPPPEVPIPEHPSATQEQQLSQWYPSKADLISEISRYTDDLKPENLGVCQDTGRWVLLDGGASRAWELAR